MDFSSFCVSNYPIRKMGIITKSTAIISAICMIGFFLIGSVFYLNGKYVGPYLIWKNDKIEDYMPTGIPRYTFDELPLRYGAYVVP